jgi:hypothetical protein
VKRTTGLCAALVAVCAGSGAAWAAPASTPGCTAGQLSGRLGPGNGTAGSVYRPVIFTNTSESTCTLFGYPGVAYVAPKTGKQVGAAATRNHRHASTTVSIKPGGHAAALLQLVDYQNYGKSSCKPATVSGLRVYPPGASKALYVPFAHDKKACSTDVHQLSVEVTRKGTSG